MIDWLGLPERASAHAAGVDEIIAWTHILMFVLFVGWVSFYLLILFRFRSGRNPKADYIGVRTHASSYIEIVIAVVEVILLVGFSIPLWASVVVEIPDTANAVEVRVVAQQFQWNIHYPGEDGIFGSVAVEFMDEVSNPVGIDYSDPAADDDFWTVNQLHLPVDRQALIYLTSKDVIHCFALPIMRVKQDIIPGMMITTAFTPIKTGASEIACAQLCGLGHYRMRGYLTVHSEEGYDSWLAEKKAELEEEEDDE